jgi:hypothetical protein
LIAALIGVEGSSAWLSHGDKTLEMVRSWIPLGLVVINLNNEVSTGTGRGRCYLS